MSLILSGVTFRYPKQRKPVLELLSLEVATGEAVALMAPSGGGKSTVLGVAGLLLAPEHGCVMIGGIRVSQRDRTRLLGTKICYIFQAIQLMQRRSVLDNITLPALTHGSRRRVAETAARRYADALGLAELLERPARHLSGGQAQRVGIARALAPEPELVIADEPTANLDRATAQEVGQVLFGLDRRRTALLVATHDPTIAALADRVVTLGAA